MKHRILPPIVLAIVFLLLLGCEDNETRIFVSFNGTTGDKTERRPGLTAGVVSLSVTDAKPLLPSGTEEVWITFEEVLLHKEGGEWISLPLLQKPYTIDLLRYHSGVTTDLIRTVSLQSGTYDRIRISIGGALVMSNGKFYPVVISSDNLTMEENFSFELEEGGAADLTLDFDLSLSLSATGSTAAPSYELLPVLHLNHTQDAARIHGQIAAATFDEFGSNEAIVTVYEDSDLSGSLTVNDMEYTRIRVDDYSGAFTIFWLVPEEGYSVAVEVDGTEPAEYEEFVYPADLQKGGLFELNYGNLL